MNEDKIKYYSEKYKNHQIKLAKIFMIIIISIGVILIGVGVFLIAYEYELYRMIVSIIMIILGISDIPIGIKFYFMNKKSISNLSDKEAIKRYAKIYGIDEKTLK